MEPIGVVIRFLQLLLQVFWWLIIARAILSWFDPMYRNPISQFLFRVTEPILAPIRAAIPVRTFIDFSPLVALLFIWLLQSVLTRVAY
jgi:YggT family protein